MLSLLRLSRQWASARYRDLQFGLFRERMRRENIHIHHKAMLRGISGITLSEGTHIGQGAAISTGSNVSNNLYAKPHGSISIGRHCAIRYGAILASYGGDIVLGNNVSVNPYAVLYGHGGLVIGDDTRIAAHVVIVPGNHIFSDPTRTIREQGSEMKGIVIGRDVWLAAGVRVLDGVTIGDGAIVGAGAVVTRDVASRSIVAGVPARPIRGQLAEFTVSEREHSDMNSSVELL